MQLTQFTDFSLRVLIYLVRLPEPGMATIPEIAEYYRISRNHLVKVVNTLANAGLLVTMRGKGGGLRLARPADTITIAEVVRLTEPNMNLVECFDPKASHCRIDRGCFLKAILYEARKDFLAALERHTLADAARMGSGSEGESPAPRGARM
ncbi:MULTISPECIES: Rrf2 family transcriptional regulator [Methylococcus]|jgi:Rrf2 family nitric oxide-sensitive transcriptional repressor|uniref:Rrf2 family protein n=2 Tax=Methylococcus capsulatus TaxID=414 RepID=Q604N3_METCA|nr:Rrf2 family transcriptional regulator [Methylococcus capsulatus]AAU91353.1 Rrf2 family protein [Methylococcus capsulatus str. Bath]QXP86927.1 Rrf2 family transcriptional regulator [Methylococcus capsulatus]QXP91726.1 Rrf2 family transcriptional regulator [Methylococcus capsulatus]QXP93393.1 Rrf2 family transcriptional regulator [Methylococcus capsulatus]UQN11908.1 Rrf2 family transcriptional regulator [Methylococcus capsulatus]